MIRTRNDTGDFHRVDSKPNPNYMVVFITSVYTLTHPK